METTHKTARNLPSIWALALAPAAAAGFLLLLFALDHLYPFGDGTLAWGDANHQVLPLLMDFQEILAGNDSMLWNQANAGGMSFWGVFFFFLASPLHVPFALLVPKAAFYFAFNLLTLSKLALAALSAAALFRRCFRNLSLPQVVCLADSYAFCGFALLYAQNTVWLDVLAWFPVLLLGARALWREGRAVLFTLALAAMVVLNFYLSAMVFFWLVLAAGMFVWIATPKAVQGPRLVLLGLSVAAALLLTGVVWLPSLFQYLHSGRTGSLVENLQRLNLFTRLNTTLPVWLCTALSAAAIPLYLLSGRKTRTATALFCVDLLLLLPVWFDPIDAMWHLGSYQAFPVRFGYMLTMMGLLLAAQHLNESGRAPRLEKSRRVPQVVSILLCAAVSVEACVLLYTNRAVLSRYYGKFWSDAPALLLSLWVIVPFLGIYFLVLFFYRKRQLSRRLVSVLLCVLVFSEAGFQARSFLTPATLSGADFAQAIDLSGRIGQDTPYRVKTENLYFDPNLLGGLGYATVGHYTSLTDAGYMHAMQALGYSTTWMEIRSSGGTLLSDALLSQQYSIITPDQNDGRDVVYENDTYQIVRQPYALQYGFFAKGLGGPLSLSGDRFAQQEAAARAVSGEDTPLFARFSPTTVEGGTFAPAADGSVSVSKGERLTYEIPAGPRATLYFDCHAPITSSIAGKSPQNVCRVTVNGKVLAQSYPTSGQNGILALGTFEQTPVKVEIDVLCDAALTSFGVAALPHARLSSVLAPAGGVSASIAGNTVTAKINAPADGYLVLPAGKSGEITATVNGESVDTEAALGEFLAVPVKAGENTVAVTVVPQGLFAGILLSALGVLALVLFAAALSRRRGRVAVCLAPAAKVVFGVVFFGLLFLLYGFPFLARAL